jgi:hypothetical protein
VVVAAAARRRRRRNSDGLAAGQMNAAAMRMRFDKRGRRLPETGHGCGCRLCEETNAPRYERRRSSEIDGGTGSSRPVWHPARRTLHRLLSGEARVPAALRDD